MRRAARLLPIAAAALALMAAPPAPARVPHKFVGTFVDQPLLESTGAAVQEFDAMVGAGVGSVRDVFDWRAAQPYASFADVPEGERGRFSDEGGVPTDWSFIDRQVRLATERRLRLLPVVLQTPAWAALRPASLASPPADPATFARFVGALARRYGPEGTFWGANPDLPRRPLRDWQVWNEPHFTEFWSERPYERDYVALLRAAHDELERVDGGARVVLAGLANTSWRYLRALYRAGARPYFDAFAVHPFTRKVSGTIEIIRRSRRVARGYGDARKPVFVTELSWTSGAGVLRRSFGFDTTPRGQAVKAREALRLLARHRRALRIDSLYWYTWLTPEANRDYPFDFAGLSRIADGRIVRKPAFRSFRATALRLVGCRSKARFADRCSD